MIAVFVNCIAVIAGSLIGIAIAGRFSKNMENVIQFGAGIVVLVLGIKMAFEFENIIYFTLAVILGGIAGTLLDIDGKIFKLGKLLERLVAKKNQNDGTSGDGLAENLQVKSKFAYGFLNSSVLFCVGAMAILGSFKAGIEKDYSIIFTKSRRIHGCVICCCHGNRNCLQCHNDFALPGSTYFAQHCCGAILQPGYDPRADGIRWSFDHDDWS